MAKASKPVTIHDQAREQFELAMTYAEDGAFASAARILRDIAGEYQRRANINAMEIAALRYLDELAEKPIVIEKD